MQPPEKRDEIAADLGWPNAFLGNETSGVCVSAYKWQDLEQTDAVKCPPMAMCQYCYPVSKNPVSSYLLKSSAVLVLTVGEVIFFAGAGVGLFWICAGKHVDMSGMFPYCWTALARSQGPFCLPLHQRAGWGCSQSWEGTRPGQLTPTDQRDVHTLWCHGQHIKLVKEGGRGEHLEWWCLSSQDTIRHDGAQLSWRWEHLPVHGKQWMNSLLWLHAWVLFSLLNCLYLTLWVFSLLFFQLSPTSWCRDSEWVAVWGLVAQNLPRRHNNNDFPSVSIVFLSNNLLLPAPCQRNQVLFLQPF